MNRKLKLTRIENWVGAGIPDLLICSDNGDFHFVELKYTTSNSVPLRPAQVSWLTRHEHSSSWVLIKKQKDPTATPECFLYPASAAIELSMNGLAKVEPAYHCKQPFNWPEIFSLICPK